MFWNNLLKLWQSQANPPRCLGGKVLPKLVDVLWAPTRRFMWRPSSAAWLLSWTAPVLWLIRKFGCSSASPLPGDSKLARKGAIMALSMDVHQGYPSLPGGSVTYFSSQKRRCGFCACPGRPNDGENGGWRFLRDVFKTSRELRDKSIPSVGFLTCLGNNNSF